MAEDMQKEKEYTGREKRYANGRVEKAGDVFYHKTNHPCGNVKG
jgi:hypothetical protein